MASEERKYIGKICYARRYSKAELVRIEDNMIVPLTPTEYKILAFFIDNINAPITLDDLARHLWGIHSDEKGKENLKPQISRIRSKLEKIHVGLGNCIDTNYGFGSYTMSDEIKQPQYRNIQLYDEPYTTHINKNEFNTGGYKPLSISKKPTITLLLIKNILFGSEQNWTFCIMDDQILHYIKVISTPRPDNHGFLKMILPESVFQFILNEEFNNRNIVDEITEGNGSDKIMVEICRCFTSDSGLRFRELRKKCKILLLPPANLSALCSNVDFLFNHLDGKVVKLLRNCYQRCIDSGGVSSALACLAFFALVGEELFNQVVRYEYNYSFFVDCN